MIFSLDANVLIDDSRKISPVRQRMTTARASGADLRISSIVLLELLIDASPGTAPTRRARAVAEQIAHLAIAGFTAADARRTAALQSTLIAERKGLGSYDALIAGQALNRGWTLVTSDAAFDRVPGLTIENWRIPA